MVVRDSNVELHWKFSYYKAKIQALHLRRLWGSTYINKLFIFAKYFSF